MVIEKPTLFVTGNYGVEPVEALLAKRPQRECLANANGVVVIRQCVRGPPSELLFLAEFAQPNS